MSTVARYPDWKAPAQDSALLIWPEPGDLIAQTLENQRRLEASSLRIGGIEVRDLRRRQRAELGLDEHSPLVATGHQTELYHAGVWAKLALITAAAKKLDGAAIHLAVDTDTPKHLHFRWPGESWPITDDPRLTNAPWSGLLKTPPASHLENIRTELAEAARQWPFAPIADEFLDAMQKQNGVSLSAAITISEQQLDSTLGLTHRTTLASPIWNGDAFGALAHELLARADEFAAIYNDALRQYRIVHRLRTDARPMPDLHVSADECESPFWLDDLAGESRQRAVARKRNGIWRLIVGGEEFALNPDPGESAGRKLQEFLRSHKSRLAPRALTLTLFMRLALVDQFVHGIGGGRYDQVTNQVIEKFFGIVPPHFAVSTATLYFPTAVGQPRVCLPCIAQEGHRLRHGLLGETKRKMVSEIAGLPRRSVQRQLVFTRMHHQLSAALQTDGRVSAWQKRVEESNDRRLEEAALFDRELFYAIQPRERLTGLIEKYRAQF